MGCSKSQPDQQPSLLHLDSQKPRNLTAKVVLLGDSGVGKSSIAMRYVNNTFSEAFDITVGGGYLQQTIRLKDNLTLKMDIWDTGGQERFRALLQMYYREAQAAIICYDVNNEKTLTSCEYWVRELKTHEENCALFLVGNKTDVKNHQTHISEAKVQMFAAANGMTWIETSARTGENVNKLFDRVAVEVAEKKLSQ